MKGGGVEGRENAVIMATYTEKSCLPPTLSHQTLSSPNAASKH